MNKIRLRGSLREIDRRGLRIDGVVNSSLGGVVPIVDGILMMHTSNHKLPVLKSKLMLLSPHHLLDTAIFLPRGAIAQAKERLQELSRVRLGAALQVKHLSNQIRVLEQ